MFIIQFDFQFPKGAIKSRRYPRAYCLEVWFQFHKGAIKSDDGSVEKAYLYRFNSIKVRLKVVPLIFGLLLFLFQFHKGAIKSRGYTTIRAQNARFQFHKGAIKRAALRSRRPALCRFQFHKGAIKRSEDAGKFDNTLVSIP